VVPRFGSLTLTFASFAPSSSQEAARWLELHGVP